MFSQSTTHPPNKCFPRDLLFKNLNCVLRDFDHCRTVSMCTLPTLQAVLTRGGGLEGGGCSALWTRKRSECLLGTGGWSSYSGARRKRRALPLWFGTNSVCSYLQLIKSFIGAIAIYSTRKKYEVFAVLKLILADTTVAEISRDKCV